MAKFLGSFTPDDQEWHELRAEPGVVTGTLAGTILGLNPWESAYTAWAKASGKISGERPQTLPMRLGQLLEPVVKQIWLEQNPGFSIEDVGTWSHDDFDWARANPDGLLTYPDGSVGILEVKTGRAFDEVPANYRSQVLWYMWVMGVKKAKLIGLFFGSELREFDIEWNQFQFDVMFARIQEWREAVLGDVAPDWDGSASTYETVREMNSDLVDESVELGTLGVALSNAQAAVDEASAELNKCKSATLDALGSAKYGYVTALGEQVVVAQRSLRAGKPVLTVKKGK